MRIDPGLGNNPKGLVVCESLKVFQNGHVIINDTSAEIHTKLNGLYIFNLEVIEEDFNRELLKKIEGIDLRRTYLTTLRSGSKVKIDRFSGLNITELKDRKTFESLTFRSNTFPDFEVEFNVVPDDTPDKYDYDNIQYVSGVRCIGKISESEGRRKSEQITLEYKHLQDLKKSLKGFLTVEPDERDRKSVV